MENLNSTSKILPIWQPVGFSTHIIAKKVSEKYGVKTSHTGTLDPMAEGVIIVLLDEERLKKYEYTAWNKTYEFEITFGIETDTFDKLGLIKSSDFRQIYEKDLMGELSTFLEKEYSQQVPAYSTIKVGGRPMHWYARNYKLSEVKQWPVRNGLIKDIKLISHEEKNLKDLIAENISQVRNLSGNFRQAEIIDNWENFLKIHSNQKVQVAKISVTMTKGLYVRALAQDICKDLGTVGFVNYISRIQNGIYTKENSKTLENIFGKGFNKAGNFNPML